MLGVFTPSVVCARALNAQDKIKIECAIQAYKHSKVITEFSYDLWNGLLDKCLVFEDHIEFKWK